MDPLLLARLQFAVTTVYHFFFVPLTLGLSVLVAIMETIYVRTGNEMYRRMTKFWGKLFLINFAMGVVTGIVQEFQFGMNWSAYSRFVGDIFGAPLAIEALLAFFLESTFLGVWIFGWEVLSKKLHAVAIWLVAIGANISAFWILIANSFMQEPVGYTINAAAGRAEMTDFFELLKNPHLWVQFPHVVLGGFTTAAFFVMGISAYHLRKKKDEELFKRSFQIAAIVGTIAVIFVGLGGHTQTQHLVYTQPMKLASAEALWQTEDPASLSLLTIGDLTQRREIFSIRVPRLLSLLSYNRMEGEVKGIYNLQDEYEALYGPGDYIPPVAITYWSFRAMVGAGTVLLALAFYAIFMVMIKKRPISERILKLFTAALFLPYLANSAGWILAEVGRTPWTVFGVLKLSDSVSPTVTPGMLLFSLIGFTLVYGALMVVDVSLLLKFAKAGPGEIDSIESSDVEPSLIGG